VALETTGGAEELLDRQVTGCLIAALMPVIIAYWLANLVLDFRFNEK